MPRSVSCVTAGAGPHKTVWERATVKKYHGIGRSGAVFDRRADHFSRGGSRKDAYADASESRTVQYRQHDADTAALSTEIHVL